jgi:RNA-directed DNA polymerase
MAGEERTALLRTCAQSTGLTLQEVAKIAATGPKRYKVYQIPKRSGGARTICHPSRELKALQRVFLRELLRDLPVHACATAYKKGSSIRENAAAHAESRVILKMDFENFFPSIRTKNWISYCSTHLEHWSRGDVDFSLHVLFWGSGGYQPDCLSIGAPTSPLISNALMYDFDVTMAKFASDYGLKYTRYADDITISSPGVLDKEACVNAVETALADAKFVQLKLNQAKTRLASKATSRRVTGLVISNDGTVSLGRDRKRVISAMVHHALTDKLRPDELYRLGGLLSFASDVEGEFIARLKKKYGDEAVASLQPRKKQ